MCTPSPGYEVREARGAGSRRRGGSRGRRAVRAARRRPDGGGLHPAPRGAGGPGAGLAAPRRRRHRGRAPRAPGGQAPARGHGRLAAGGARACWDLDTTGWVDLPDSCFTYSAAGRALLETRAVTRRRWSRISTARRPARARIFVRKKVDASRAHRIAAPPLPLDARQRPRLRPPLSRSTWRPRTSWPRRLDHLAAAVPGHLHRAPGQDRRPRGPAGGRRAAQAHPDACWAARAAAPSCTT